MCLLLHGPNSIDVFRDMRNAGLLVLDKPDISKIFKRDSWLHGTDEIEVSIGFC